MKDKFERYKKDVLKRQTENEIIKENIDNNNIQIKILSDQLVLGQEALQFIEDVANSRRSVMREQIEEVITEALQSIYGLDYKIELVYDVKNNRSHLDIKVCKNTEYGEIKRDMDGFGGGVADTISVPLRLLVLLACKQTDKICLLDECYKHVNPERIELVSQFLSEICNKLGIQIIMDTHHEIFKNNADVVYMIKDDNGKSIIERL